LSGLLLRYDAPVQRPCLRAAPAQRCESARGRSRPGPGGTPPVRVRPVWRAGV